MPVDPAHPEFAPLPPRLAAELATLHPQPRVPAALDQKILAAGHAEMLAQFRRRRIIRWTSLGSAAAAAIVVVALVLPKGRTADETSAPVAALARAGDLDRDGRVDILDAFNLARRIAAHHGPITSGVSKTEDVNGDGIVDQKDVDLIARMAVRVTVAANDAQSDRGAIQ